MPQHPYRFRKLVCGAALAIMGASVRAEPLDKDARDEARPPVQGRPAAAVPAPSGEHIDSLSLERLKRARMNVKKSATFAAKSWYVPTPAPKPQPTPIPTPTAPPLPFTYLGKIQEPQGKLTFFLSDGNQVRLVSTGETINDTYSVDGVEDSRLVITYLPLRIKQYLSLGEAP